MVTRLLTTPSIPYPLVVAASSRPPKPSRNSHPSPTCAAPSTPPPSTSAPPPTVNLTSTPTAAATTTPLFSSKLSPITRSSGTSASRPRRHQRRHPLPRQPPLPPSAALSPHPYLPQRDGYPRVKPVRWNAHERKECMG
ncbi:uncharacterized protein HKW66_Vig0248610 [Vigna angularis]|uniref:Uncharacterized protein n=1 Tax=Phaseolus angularis TaxID=3914 RepID=A0A8T0JTW0_PHAAN|nr:uncharacterized protein HKW66_Vig0248610 [Vigna angularis]